MVLGPENRVVSIVTTTADSSPGSNLDFTTLALLHTWQETRTPEIVTVFLVVFLMRKGCGRVGPRGDEPKSLESSSKSASAHDPARTGLAAQKPARRTIE